MKNEIEAMITDITACLLYTSMKNVLKPTKKFLW